MWLQKNIIHSNNGWMVQGLFIKHGGERKWRIQTFTLAFKDWWAKLLGF